jgi:hypothetical protein
MLRQRAQIYFPALSNDGGNLLDVVNIRQRIRFKQHGISGFALLYRPQIARTQCRTRTVGSRRDDGLHGRHSQFDESFDRSNGAASRLEFLGLDAAPEFRRIAEVAVGRRGYFASRRDELERIAVLNILSLLQQVHPPPMLRRRVRGRHPGNSRFRIGALGQMTAPNIAGGQIGPHAAEHALRHNQMDNIVREIPTHHLRVLNEVDPWSALPDLPAADPPLRVQAAADYVNRYVGSGGRVTGPREFKAPAEWNRYVGHYRNEDPWIGSNRIVLRKGQLWLNAVVPLELSTDGRFFPRDEPSSPEWVSFSDIVNGNAMRMRLSGADLTRV